MISASVGTSTIYFVEAGAVSVTSTSPQALASGRGPEALLAERLIDPSTVRLRVRKGRRNPLVHLHIAGSHCLVLSSGCRI